MCGDWFFFSPTWYPCSLPVPKHVSETERTHILSLPLSHFSKEVPVQSRCCDSGCCGRTLDNVISVTEWDVEAGGVYFEIQRPWSRTHGSGDHVAKFFQMVVLWNLPLIPQWNISVTGIKCLWVSAVVPPPSRFKEDVIGEVFFKKMYQLILFLQGLSLGKLLQWTKSVECVLPLMRSFCTC